MRHGAHCARHLRRADRTHLVRFQCRARRLHSRRRTSSTWSRSRSCPRRPRSIAPKRSRGASPQIGTQATRRRARGGVRRHVGQWLHSELECRHSCSSRSMIFEQRQLGGALGPGHRGGAEREAGLHPGCVRDGGHAAAGDRTWALSAASSSQVEDRTDAGPAGAVRRAVGGARQGRTRIRRSAAPSAPTRSTCRSWTSTSIASR